MERDLKCMYCAEAGITNTDVFIEIVDVELGAGWICKECFIESEKEKEEHLKELEQELKAKEQECDELKEKLIKWLGKDGLRQSEKEFYEQQLDQLKAEYDKLKAENKILKEKFEIAIKNNMDKTLLRLEKGDVQEELQEIREQFGIETLYCHYDNTRVHRCLVLTEIKEIAETAAKCMYATYSDDYTEGYRWLGSIILQKISECEVE